MSDAHHDRANTNGAPAAPPAALQRAEAMQPPPREWSAAASGLRLYLQALGLRGRAGNRLLLAALSRAAAGAGRTSSPRASAAAMYALHRALAARQRGGGIAGAGSPGGTVQGSTGWRLAAWRAGLPERDGAGRGPERVEEEVPLPSMPRIRRASMVPTRLDRRPLRRALRSVSRRLRGAGSTLARRRG